MIRFAEDLVREAGASLMHSFGSVGAVQNKGDASNVVTDVDMRTDRLIVDRIRKRFPGHSIISEEAGVASRRALHGPLGQAPDI